jgi:iron complex outermembrane receptor protein
MEASSGRFSNLRLLGLSVFAALGTFSSGFLVAQNAQAPDQSVLAEVIVTAQYREEKLQDTPIAITAITSDMIEAQGATRLSDILTSAPSVGFRQQSAAFGESVTAFIRGFGQADFDPAFEPGVGLYIDDVYYPRLTGANFDLMDVERVEVLRGPQGTLEGRNSEGGAIRFVTRKPTGEGGGYVTATYGTRNRLDLRASADFKLAEHLFARVSGTFSDQDGYVDVFSYGCAFPASGVPAPTGGIKCDQYALGDVGYRAVRASLRFNPSDRLDMLLSADYIRDRHNNGAEVLLYGNNPNPNVATPNGVPFDSRFLCGKWCNYTTLGNGAASFVGGFLGFLNGVPMPATSGVQQNTFDAYDLSLNIDVGITDAVKLNSITGYHNWTNRFSIDQDLSPAQVQFGNNTLDHWFWSEELRLNMDFGKQVHATVGGYYSDENTTYYTMQDIRYVAIGPTVPAAACPFIAAGAGIPGGLATATCPIEPLQFLGNDPVKTSSKAAFGTLIWDVTDALALTGGVRYSKDEKSYTYYRYNLDGQTINPFVDPVGAVYGIGYSGPDTLNAIPGSGGGTVTALSGRTATFKGSRTDYHFSADYRFNPAVMAYASVGTGYKSGGVGPRPFNAAQARAFGPEKLISYELGLKTDLFDKKLRFNTAIFYNDFTDAQLVLLTCPQYGGPGPCALPQNAGDATVKGVEAEIFALPVAGLQIDLSGSYLDWKWKCVDPQVVGGAAGPCSSDPAVINLLSSTPIGFIKEQFHAGIQYEFHLSNGTSLTPRFDTVYQGPAPGSNLAATAGTPSDVYGRVAGFTVSNVRMIWRNSNKDLEATLEATNVFNKYYFYSKFDLSSLAGTITGSPAPPLAWALTVKKTF